jgi:hypothetical protein
MVARWIPRLERGTLLEDLGRALWSFARIERLSLRPHRVRRFHGRVLVRGVWHAAGVDLAGMRRSDHGLLDLTLVQRRHRWWIDHLAFVRLHTVRRQEPGYADTGTVQKNKLSPDANRTQKFVSLDRPRARGDLDGDGRADLVRAGKRGTTVWLAPGSGRRRWRATRLWDPGQASWIGLVDHDNDGDLDLVVLGREGAGENALYLNAGKHGWVEASAAAGLPTVGPKAAAAFVDANGDGAPDLLLGDRLFTWQGGAGDTDVPGATHALVLRLRSASPGNRAALGSRVQVEAGGRRQVRWVGEASGLPNGPPGTIHVGVGDEVRISAVTVHWPDGRVERQVDLPVNRLVTLDQGEPPRWDATPVDRDAPAAQPDARPAEPLDPPAAPPTSRPAGRLDAALHRRVAELAGQSRATLLLLAPSPCPNCVRLCATLKQRAVAHPGVGVAVLAVAPALRCTLPVATVGPALLLSLSPVLPATLLVDAGGRVIALYAGLPGKVQLAADLAAVGQAP